MRILVRTSKWAIWARRLGSFGLPLAIVPVLMHRARAISTDSFAVIEIVAIAVALLAIVIAISAFARIWVTGDHGWGRAVTGFFFGLLCLVPVGFWGAEFVTYPLVDEISTDTANPPPLLADIKPVPPSPAVAQRIAARFPNIKSRNYPLPAVQMFDIINSLVVDKGWDVRRRREPTDDGQDGQLNAIATTLFGFRDEVSVRVSSDGADGSIIAMRSAALSQLHEPGVNGSRVEDFLTALDAKIAVLMKDEPAGSSDDSSDATATDQPQAPVIPAPTPRGRKR